MHQLYLSTYKKKVLTASILLIHLSLLLSVFNISCFKKESPNTSGPSLDNLFQSWYTISTLQKENIDYLTALQISQEMISRYGDTAINRLFHVIEDEQEKPMAKVLAVMSLTPYLKEDWANKLIPLTTPEKEVNTRVCAINLLSLILTPDVTNHLKTLANDKEPRVRFEVLTALSKRGESEGYNKINELWDLAKDNSEQREHILLSIPPNQIPNFIHIFRLAVQDEQITKSVRREALINLGRFGKEEDIDILNKVVEKESEGELRELAQSAIDAINARIQHSTSSSNSSN
ncbi:MAG TPA: HEAT repeat domain-containing protein [Candidatus Hydrogenedens sp.]|nr:HEAT repeat domain-containing protein [Candidatus Hydrogenedens sp.]HOK09834.1 HEAT repeat domain-containing protein [Candidatus Hydrogenedens sp.]HOL19491.1 HEAT repeat domain-containing protein [Candidatus Hydrogenedens sp.]HPP59405.1 HEAT repeat domain-containing protein [Candidatus Hydrogenedens sp.]